MRKIIESTIKGTFDGWNTITTYGLDDGSCWRMTSPYYLDLLAHRPQAAIYYAHERYYMQIAFRDEYLEVIRAEQNESPTVESIHDDNAVLRDQLCEIECDIIRLFRKTNPPIQGSVRPGWQQEPSASSRIFGQALLIETLP